MISAAAVFTSNSYCLQ